jgi:hypothetical protein
MFWLRGRIVFIAMAVRAWLPCNCRRSVNVAIARYPLFGTVAVATAVREKSHVFGHAGPVVIVAMTIDAWLGERGLGLVNVAYNWRPLVRRMAVNAGLGDTPWVLRLRRCLKSSAMAVDANLGKHRLRLVKIASGGRPLGCAVALNASVWEQAFVLRLGGGLVLRTMTIRAELARYRWACVDVAVCGHPTSC